MQNLSEEFVTLTTRLMLAHERAEVLRITADMNTAILRLAEIEKTGHYTTPEKTISETLKFTHKEISKMSKTFKKEFVANGLVAHVTKRISGKRTYCYEIRYRSNGYNITASSTDLATAKAKFIEKTLPENINKYYLGTTAPTDNITFEKFALFYFKKHRQKKVAEATYKTDCKRLQKHIFPALGRFDIKKITPDKCQALIEKLQDEGKGKTADEIYSLLSVIFKGALAYGYIDKSPLAIIDRKPHERQSGTALTKAEEKQLLTGLTEPIYRKAAAIALYTGLRPNELYTAKIEGAFIVAVNSKRKNGKVEYKRIPIINALKPYLQDGIGELPNIKLIRSRFNALFPNHRFYDLRTTFFSRCEEYGVAPPAKDEFLGHCTNAITKAYRSLSDEYLLAEAAKLNAWE